MAHRLYLANALRAARSLLLIVLMWIAVALVARAQESTIVCPNGRIDLIQPDGSVKNFDRGIAGSKRFIGSATGEPSKMRVYVTAEHDFLFFGGNFKPSGANFPIEIATQTHCSLRQIAENLMTCAGQFHGPAGASRAYSDAVFYFDHSLISSPLFKKLNVDEEATVNYVDARGQVWPTKVSEDGSRHIQYSDHVFGKPPTPFDFETATERHTVLTRIALKQSPRVLNLVYDRDASSNIAQKIPPSNTLGDPLDPLANGQNIGRLVSGQSNRLVVILAHLVGKNVVMENARGETIFSCPVKSLDEACWRNHVDYVLLGCSAGAIDRISGPTGTIEATDAALRVKAALGARNGMNFMERLAKPAQRGSSPWTIVVDRSFLVHAGSAFDATANLREIVELNDDFSAPITETGAFITIRGRFLPTH